MSYRYNEDMEPPAPYCDILVSNPNLSRQVNLPALFDTGCDISIIPLDSANELGLEVKGTGALEGVTGDVTELSTFEVYLSVDRSAREKLEVMGWHESFAILGRDVLNRYLITLDGPNLTLTITR